MFVPKESDKQWMRNLIKMLNVNGTWATDWAIYKKVDETTLQVVHKINDIDKENVDDNIDRVRIVMESIGGKLIE